MTVNSPSIRPMNSPLILLYVFLSEYLVTMAFASQPIIIENHAPDMCGFTSIIMPMGCGSQKWFFLKKSNMAMRTTPVMSHPSCAPAFSGGTLDMFVTRLNVLRGKRV